MKGMLKTTVKKKRIAFVGNCQMAVSRYLQGIPAFSDAFSFKVVYVFKISERDMEIFLDECPSFDFIVTQKISNVFRGNKIFGTDVLLSHTQRGSCKVVLLPSCYFDFSFPFSTSKDMEYRETLIDHIVFREEASDFTDDSSVKKKVDDLLNANASVDIEDIYCKIFNDPDLFERRVLEQRFRQSIEKLVDKESQNKEYAIKKGVEKCITISDYIVNSCGSLLFYTFNHPTAQLLMYISFQIYSFLMDCKHATLPAGYERQRLFLSKSDYELYCQYELLDNYKTPIPMCFQPFFDIDLAEYNKNLSFRGTKCDYREFFGLYVQHRIDRDNFSGSLAKRMAHIQTRKPTFLSNKNIYPGMDQKIVRCTVQRKVGSGQQKKLLRCCSTTSMNFSDSMAHNSAFSCATDQKLDNVVTTRAKIFTVKKPNSVSQRPDKVMDQPHGSRILKKKSMSSNMANMCAVDMKNSLDSDNMESESLQVPDVKVERDVGAKFIKRQDCKSRGRKIKTTFVSAVAATAH
jgi:hypothetical protein